MSATAAVPGIKQMLDIYQRMTLIRAFEEQTVELFSKGHITGSTHPCIGQEAIAVGLCAALHLEDQLFATYRGHGAALAKGSDPGRLMAELLTRTTGCCRGRGGSMHLCDRTVNFLGTNAIVAAHIPIAGGAALANKLRRNGLVTACMFGDGASCEGEFFETLNMAAIWKIPLIFVCENNGYAISVPTLMSQSTPDIMDRALGFGIHAEKVDGNDPLAVLSAAARAAARARANRGPTLIECKTTRWERHSAFSAGRYENTEEAQKWKQVDPIPRFAALLLSSGVEPRDLACYENEARQAIDAAVQFALASPLPSPDSVYEGIYADDPGMK